jgi:hypothetical protein
MKGNVSNSCFFEERGFVMIEACQTAQAAVINGLANKAKALRSDFFKQMAELQAMANRAHLEENAEVVDV